ncbi:MAG: hypothetical protein Q9168_000932 [Polycauliona sp. 1 TL-2023]
MDSSTLVTGNPRVSQEALAASMSSLPPSNGDEDHLADFTDPNVDAGAALSEVTSELTAARSQYMQTNPSRPIYRVTSLTTLMTDTLADSLSTMVANILLLPLEALLVRSVAFTYLNTADGAAYSAMGLQKEIYPLGSWLGNGLRGGRAMDYGRKMILCFGVDMLLSLATWQATTGVAWWMGKRKLKRGKGQERV